MPFNYEHTPAGLQLKPKLVIVYLGVFSDQEMAEKIATGLVNNFGPALVTQTRIKDLSDAEACVVGLTIPNQLCDLASSIPVEWQPEDTKPDPVAGMKGAFIYVEMDTDPSIRVWIAD